MIRQCPYILLLFLLGSVLLGGDSLENLAAEIRSARELKEETLNSLRTELANAHQQEITLRQQNEQLTADKQRLQNELTVAEGLNNRLGQLQKQPVSGEPYATQAISPQGIVVRGNALTIGPITYFATTGDVATSPVYGFLRPAENAGSLPEFVPASQAYAEQIHALFTTGHATALPMDFSGNWQALHATEPEANTLWQHFSAGGPVMLPILLCGWLTLFVLLRRIIAMCSATHRKQFENFRKNLRVTAVEGVLSDSAFRSAEEEARKLVAESARGQSVLAACAAVSPLLGLLGTVTGMIRTFHALSSVGASGELADGIAEALVTTEAGLMVAIPAVLLHAWGRRRTATLATSLEKELKRYE